MKISVSLSKQYLLDIDLEIYHSSTIGNLNWPLFLFNAKDFCGINPNKFLELLAETAVDFNS